LTNSVRAIHDVIVSRVVSLVLALVVALWLPLQRVSVRDHATAPSQSSGNLQTERPPQTGSLVPLAMTGAIGTWQARHVYDALASEGWSPRLHDCSLSTAVHRAQGEMHAVPSFRLYPLLI
jgi:hypothetical protein